MPPDEPVPASSAKAAVARPLPTWILAGLAIAALPALLFPGDAPFVNDEPLLLASALDANEAGRLAAQGLWGNRGLVYGPLPTWIYQALLVTTHDPRTLVFLHAALLTAGTLGALVWLARTTGLWAPFAVTLALSPRVWFSSRQLWDNNFNVPIGALALAAYLHFLVRRSRWSLAVAVAGLAAAPFIHPMALALVVPVAVHMAAFERRALLRHAWIVMPFPALLLGLSAGYLRAILQGARSVGRIDGAANVSQGLSGFALPLFGGRFLSAEGMSPGAGTSALAEAARSVSQLALPLVWAGAAWAAWRLLAVLRGRQPMGIREHLAALALGILVAQSALDGAMKVAPHDHYFNATWIAYAVLAWLLTDALVEAAGRWARVAALLAAIQGLALAVVAADFVAVVRASPGPVSYGLTIGQQAEVAREVARYPAGTPVVSDIYPISEFPHALATITRLVAPRTAPTAGARRLVVRLQGEEPRARRVVVVPED